MTITAIQSEESDNIAHTPARENAQQIPRRSDSAISFKNSKLKKNSSTDESISEQDLCRICQIGGSDNSDNPLITPCKCAGSVRYVHQSCLQKWIKSSDIKCCELCRYEFKMQTKLKPFSKWEKLDMSTSERRKILCSIGFHLVAITCVIWSLYVLIQRTAQEIRQKEFHWPFWTKLVVVAIGFIGGIVFMYVQCKVYVQLWRRLKAFNRVIYVQNNPLISIPDTTDNLAVHVASGCDATPNEPGTSSSAARGTERVKKESAGKNDSNLEVPMNPSHTTNGQNESPNSSALGSGLYQSSAYNVTHVSNNPEIFEQGSSESSVPPVPSEVVSSLETDSASENVEKRLHEVRVDLSFESQGGQSFKSLPVRSVTAAASYSQV